MTSAGSRPGPNGTRTRPWGSGTPSLPVIVKAALAIIDREGVEALTTRLLADELEMFQSNLYRRIRDRDHLLDLVVEAIMAEVGLPEVDPAEWRDWLTDCALRVWRTWLRHPRAAVLLHHGGAYPATLGVIDATLGVLLRRDYTPEAALSAIQAYLGYVWGTTVLDAQGRAQDRPSTPAELTPEQAASYPNLGALQELLGSSPEPAGDGDDGGQAAFLAGLTLVLDGIARLDSPT